MAHFDLETKNLLQEIIVNENFIENNLNNEYEILKADLDKQEINFDDKHNPNKYTYIKGHNLPCDLCQSQKNLFNKEFSHLKDIHNDHMAEYEKYINKLKSNITAKNSELTESSEKYIQLNEKYQELQAKFYEFERLIFNLKYERDKLCNQLNLEEGDKEQIVKLKDQDCGKIKDKMTLLQQQYEESQVEILNIKIELKNQSLNNEHLNLTLMKLKKENVNFKDENEALRKELSCKEKLLTEELTEFNHIYDTEKCELLSQMKQTISPLTNQNLGSDVETLIQNFQTQIHTLEDEYESKSNLNNEKLVEENQELKKRVEELVQEIMRQRDKWTSQAHKLNQLMTEQEKCNRAEITKFRQISMQENGDLLRLVAALRKELVREKASKVKAIVGSKEEMSQIADRHRLAINKISAENEGLVKTLKDAKDCLDHLVVQNETHNQYCSKSLEEVSMQHEKELGRYKVYLASLEDQLTEIMATQKAQHKKKKEKLRLLKENGRSNIDFRPRDGNKRTADHESGPKLQEVKIADKIFYTIPSIYKGS